MLLSGSQRGDGGIAPTTGAGNRVRATDRQKGAHEMTRYTVEQATWDDADNCIGSIIILETDDQDEAIAAADRDHGSDPNGQTVVYDDTTIIYEAKG